MRKLRIESRDNYEKLVTEFCVDFFGVFRWYPTITQEQIVSHGKPLWLKIIQWWIVTFCNHKWEKPKDWFNFASGFQSKYECTLCKKEKIVWNR